MAFSANQDHGLTACLSGAETSGPRGGFVAGTKIDAVKDSPPVRGVTSATFPFGTILNLGATSVPGISGHGVGPGNNGFDVVDGARSPRQRAPIG
jgi:hypothetical protein